MQETTLTDFAGSTLTMQYHPDGQPCQRCGQSAERRWIADGRLVCPQCKAWTESE